MDNTAVTLFVASFIAFILGLYSFVTGNSIPGNYFFVGYIGLWILSTLLLGIGIYIYNQDLKHEKFLEDLKTA